MYHGSFKAENAVVSWIFVLLQFLLIIICPYILQITVHKEYLHDSLTMKLFYVPLYFMAHSIQYACNIMYKN